MERASSIGEVNRFDRGALELAGGEGAGFIKGDDGAAGEGIESDASFEENPFAGAGADGAEIGGWRGNDEGARRGGDEKGESAVDGAFEAEIAHGKEEGRPKSKEKGEGDDGGRVVFAKSVEPSLQAGFCLLGLRDELDDASEGRIGAVRFTSMARAASRLRAPAGTGSPTVLGTGMLSPVRWTRLTEEVPSIDFAVERDDFSVFHEDFFSDCDFADRFFKEDPSSSMTWANLGAMLLRLWRALLALLETVSSMP